MATHIATVCEFAAKRDFLANYRNKIIGVVPNGVVIPDAASRRDISLRSRWGVPEGWPVGICVSRITEEKGYAVLASALSLLDRGNQKFSLMIVGGGDEDGRLRSLFAGLRNIKIVFVGHQKDVSSFLSASDFFLFPSLHENLSNALIEAMAHGLPVIATDVGGNTEVVSKGGGILIPVKNPDAIADAVSRFLCDSTAMRSMGNDARENVRRNYSVQQMVAGWEAIYAQILEGGRCNGSV
ncbi:hypothetical protein CF70_019300 [Cupriavidus sp. SK-3]|nr:hypothetical protein CF70_019300 [Cupriavidus sp. SK-3]